MLSALFFMNRKGEILISRVYRDDVKFVLFSCDFGRTPF